MEQFPQPCCVKEGKSSHPLWEGEGVRGAESDSGTVTGIQEPLPKFRSCNTSLFVCEIGSVLVCGRASVFWLFPPTDRGPVWPAGAFGVFGRSRRTASAWGGLQAEESSAVIFWLAIDPYPSSYTQSVPPFRSSTWWGGAICPLTLVSSTRTAPKPWKGWWPTASRSPRMRGRFSRRWARVLLLLESQLDSSFNGLGCFFCFFLSLSP